MLSRIFLRTTALLSLAAVLSACGGGGADSSAAAPQINPRLFERQASQVDLALCAAQAVVADGQVSYKLEDGQCTAVFTDADGKIAQAKAKASRVVRAAKPVDATALMDWAQQVFKPFFPDNVPNIAIPGFVVRYYPSSQNYLGVADDGSVYIMGPLTGSQLAKVGKLTDFTCSIYPDNCLLDLPGVSLQLGTDKALVTQGGTFTVPVTITRLEGFQGSVNVALSQLPQGVTAPAITVPANATTATLTLTAQATAPHSRPDTALVTATAGTASTTQPLTVTVRGTAGSVDTSFGAAGKIITEVGAGEDYANAVTVQADGKVIVAGSSRTNTATVVSLVRYSIDGDMDVTFGTGGKVLTSVSERSDVAYAIAVQPDGKILVAGSSDQSAAGNGLDFMLVRYNTNGTLDTTFGNGGKVVTDILHQGNVARAMVLQADGKIVLGGEALVNSSTSGVDFALARYTTNGTLDTTFGSGGTVTTALKTGAGSDVVRGLALQTVDGEARILAAGGDGDFLAARYTAAGVLDNSFATGGKLVGVFGSNIGGANSVVVLPDGKAVLAGHTNNDLALVKLQVSGSLDTTFNATGKMVYPISSSGNWDQATAIARQSDGKLVVGGWVYSGNSSSGDFVIQRYTENGYPDDTFGDHSTVILPMANGTLSDLSHALILQADPRLPTVRAIQAGEASGSNYNFAVTRFWL